MGRHNVKLCLIKRQNISKTLWRYGDSNPGPLACHASALASCAIPPSTSKLIVKP